MKKTVELAIKRVLISEGGFVDHPLDKGGPTKYGITMATLSKWLGRKANVEDVNHLKSETAEQIYYEFFWRPMGLDLLIHPTIAFLIFDQGVMQGGPDAVKLAQRLANRLGAAKIDLKVDGVIGPKTAEAINGYPYMSRLIARYIRDVQKHFFDVVKANPSQHVFLRGWIARSWSYLDLL